jgi:hypothetical protein
VNDIVTPDTDKLAELIRRKLELLTNLRDMGRRQMQFVCDGAMAQLLDVLSAKQRVLNELQRVEKGFDPFRGQDPETRHWRNSESRIECSQMLDDCEVLLRETVEQERQSEAAMTVRRDEAAVKLQGAHVAGLARGAYNAPNADTISQLDLSSEG